MQSPSPHRKRIKHIEHPGHVRQLTFSCYRRLPLLARTEWLPLLSRAIDAACLRHGWALAAFVFMPEHVHLLGHPLMGSSGVDAVLRALKRPFSFRIKQRLSAGDDPLLQELTVRQRPGVQTFRFWQEGPGYDRNLISRAAVLAAIDYVHENPVRRRLCSRSTEWRWSSARWYADGQIDPDLPTLTQLPTAFFD